MEDGYTANREELSDKLKVLIVEQNLPAEIRIIQPNPETQVYGIFFKLKQE